MKRSSKNVLVVDDNEASRCFVSFLLKNLGCEVTEVENGEHSLVLMHFKKYDLVILDWNMPQLNGSETLLQGDSLAQQMQKPKIPVLIYTGTPFTDLNIPNVSNFQIRAFLSKKMSPSQQLKRIKQALLSLN